MVWGIVGMGMGMGLGFQVELTNCDMGVKNIDLGKDTLFCMATFTYVVQYGIPNILNSISAGAPGILGVQTLSFPKNSFVPSVFCPKLGHFLPEFCPNSRILKTLAGACPP